MQALKIRKPRIKTTELGYLLLLIPFFKLLSFGLFQEHNFHSSLFGIIEKTYDIGRVLAASIGYILEIKYLRRYKLTELAKWLIIMFLAQTVACILNRSVDTFFLIKIYTYIGFVLICNWANNRLPESGMKADTMFFKWLSFLGIMSILLFPLGLLHADRVYTAIYFLGSKNASFPFYYLFLFSWYLATVIKSRKLPALWYIPPVFMIVASTICRSVNSLIAVLLIIVIALLFIRIRPRIKIAVVLIVLSAILTSIYIGSNIPALSKFLALFGRDTTFSQRTILWAQAFKNFNKTPIYGGGYSLIYNIWGEHTDHAHSWYLDVLAKYGLLGFVPFVVIIIILIKQINDYKDKEIASFVGLLSAVYLLYMGFDDYNLNFFALIVMRIDGVSRRKFSYKHKGNKINLSIQRRTRL